MLVTVNQKKETREKKEVREGEKRKIDTWRQRRDAYKIKDCTNMVLNSPVSFLSPTYLTRKGTI